MSVGFRPAERSQAKPLIGLYSESGCGKTKSALLLARGFVGPAGRIGMIETEAGRGEVYQGEEGVGDYLVRPIRGDFSPAEYGRAITEGEQAKLDALIVDSASHEWEAAGGVLSMAAANQAKGMKGVLVWQQPKLEHQRHFMLRFMQTPIPFVVLCMRAKYPMVEQRTQSGGKEWTRSDQLEPKQADDILFELMVHGWIDKTHRFHGTKYTVPSLREAMRDGEPLSNASGERLAAWARSLSAPAKISGRQWLADRNAELDAGFQTLDQARGWLSQHNPTLEKVRAKAPDEAMALVGRYHELARPLETAAMATGEAA